MRGTGVEMGRRDKMRVKVTSWQEMEADYTAAHTRTGRAKIRSLIRVLT